MADLTYVRTWSGFVYVSFITDVYSRMIVGSQAPARCASTSRSTRWSKRSGPRPVSTFAELSTTGQGRAISLDFAIPERLAETGAVNSVGSKGDSFDNALAETMIGLYKAELVRNQGPWHGLEDLEYATLEWVDWFNHRRLSEAHGQIPPAEYESIHYPPPRKLRPPGRDSNRNSRA